MVRWPFFEPTPLSDVMESLLQEERRRRGGRQGAPMPVNVYQEEGSVVVQAAMPGIDPDDVDIHCSDGLLTIRAQTRVADRTYLHQEIQPVEWMRQLALPPDCRFEAAEASADNGILTIRIPQERPRAPEKIRIQVTRKGGPAQTIEAKPGSGYSEVKSRRKPGPKGPAKP
jgi:HSP20 family protein